MSEAAYYCPTCSKFFESSGELDACTNCDHQYSHPNEDGGCPECGSQEYEMSCPDCGSFGNNFGLDHAECWAKTIEAQKALIAEAEGLE